MPPTRTTLHRGSKFDLEQVEIPGPGGRPIKREIVRHPGAVVILPILETPNGSQIVLIHNDRIALGKPIYELPAGTLEPMESPAECAPRELTEETGYEASSLKQIARFYTSPGMSDELMTAFVATGLRHVGQRLEADERLTVALVPTTAAFAMIDSGNLMDGKSMLTILLAERLGVLSRA